MAKHVRREKLIKHQLLLQEALDRVNYSRLGDCDYFTSSKSNRTFFGNVCIPEGFSKDQEYLVFNKYTITSFADRMKYFIEEAKEDAMLAEQELEAYKNHFGELPYDSK